MSSAQTQDQNQGQSAPLVTWYTGAVSIVPRPDGTNAIFDENGVQLHNVLVRIDSGNKDDIIIRGDVQGGAAKDEAKRLMAIELEKDPELRDSSISMIITISSTKTETTGPIRETTKSVVTTVWEWNNPN